MCAFSTTFRLVTSACVSHHVLDKNRQKTRCSLSEAFRASGSSGPSMVMLSNSFTLRKEEGGFPLTTKPTKGPNRSARLCSKRRPATSCNLENIQRPGEQLEAKIEMLWMSNPPSVVGRRSAPHLNSSSLAARFPCLRPRPLKPERSSYSPQFLSRGSRGSFSRRPTMDNVSLRVHALLPALLITIPRRAQKILLRIMGVSAEKQGGV